MTLVGHNPGLLELVNALTGQMLENLPTTAVCHIALPITSWQQIALGQGLILYQMTAKKLR